MPKKTVPVNVAEAVREVILEHYGSDGSFSRPYLFGGEHEGLDSSAKVVSWEEGPYEWVFDEALREKIDAKVGPRYYVEAVAAWGCLAIYLA